MEIFQTSHVLAPINCVTHGMAFCFVMAGYQSCESCNIVCVASRMVVKQFIGGGHIATAITISLRKCFVVVNWVVFSTWEFRYLGWFCAGWY